MAIRKSTEGETTIYKPYT